MLPCLWFLIVHIRFNGLDFQKWQFWCQYFSVPTQGALKMPDIVKILCIFGKLCLFNISQTRHTKVIACKIIRGGFARGITFSPLNTIPSTGLFMPVFAESSPSPHPSSLQSQNYQSFLTLSTTEHPT